MRARLRKQFLNLPGARPILDYRAQLAHVAAPRHGVGEVRITGPLRMSDPVHETRPVVFVQQREQHIAVGAFDDEPRPWAPRAKARALDPGVGVQDEIRLQGRGERFLLGDVDRLAAAGIKPMADCGQRCHRDVQAALESGLAAEQLERCEFRVGRGQGIYRARPAGMKSIQFVGAMVGARTAVTVGRDGSDDQFRKGRAQIHAIQPHGGTVGGRYIMEQHVGAA